MNTRNTRSTSSASSPSSAGSAGSASSTGSTGSTRRVTIPAISCTYCSRLIKRELETIEGVKVVVVNLPLREVVVEWQPPATWEAIVRMLKEIEYPPKEN